LLKHEPDGLLLAEADALLMKVDQDCFPEMSAEKILESLPSRIKEVEHDR